MGYGEFGRGFSHLVGRVVGNIMANSCSMLKGISLLSIEVRKSALYWTVLWFDWHLCS